MLRYHWPYCMQALVVTLTHNLFSANYRPIDIQTVYHWHWQNLYFSKSQSHWHSDCLSLALAKSIFQQITVRLAYQLRWPEHRYSQILISLEFIFSLTSKATVTNYTRQVTCFSRLCIFIFVKPLKSFSAVLFAELMRKQNGGLWIFNAEPASVSWFSC